MKTRFGGSGHRGALADWFSGVPAQYSGTDCNPLLMGGA